MQWDKFSESVANLWEAEEENAEWDERRELARADRAATGFAEVLVRRAVGASGVVVGTLHAGYVHVERIGASWLDGVECTGGSRTIVAFAAIDRIAPTPRCACRFKVARHFPHVSIGAVLRELERTSTPVTAQLTTGGVRGTVRAVWRDAIDVGQGDHVETIPLVTIIRIVVDRS